MNAVSENINTNIKKPEDKSQQGKDKRLWVAPWGYRESFLVAIGLFVTGLLLQISTQAEIKVASYPENIIVLATLAISTVVVHALFKTHPVIKWLRSVPASISSIVLLVFLVIIMGSIPQAHFKQGVEKDFLGFSSMLTSWTFMLSMLYFIITLGFTTVNRIFPWRRKNLGFILNHLGLWVTVVTATLGAGDLQRLTMDLYEGSAEWRALDGEGKVKELPIALKLNQFVMEEFPPKLAFADNTKGELIEAKGGNDLVMLEEGLVYEHLGWKIEVQKYIYESVRVGEGRYESVNEDGAAPSAQVKATNIETGEIIEGWISSGSFLRQYEGLKLSEAYSLIMTRPEPKKFASDITYYTADGAQEKATIEVNKPLAVDGWKIYQLSYDDRFGRWSKLSVVELVRDPWLPAVYVGIAMMLLGVIDIMWAGYKEKKANA